ncbi:threonine/homoserine/homoserine lactone efflux protein [Pseudomonas frederiksbergensis]
MFSAALIYIMAVISPGPNFIIVSRFSSLHSVTAGVGATVDR